MRRTVFLYLKRCICMLVTAEATIQKNCIHLDVCNIFQLFEEGDCDWIVPFFTKTLSMLWPSLDKSRDWGIKDRHTKRVCHTACGAYCVMITGNEIGKTQTLEPVGVLCMNFKRTSSTISLLLFLSRFLTVTLRTCVWDFSLH